MSHLIYRIASEYESLLELSEPFIIKPEPRKTCLIWGDMNLLRNKGQVSNKLGLKET